MPSPRARRGSAVSNLFLIFAGFASCAFVVDLGWGWIQQQRIQSIADAAATAGASHLDGTYDGVVAAKTAATKSLYANLYEGEKIWLDVTETDRGYGHEFTFGHFNSDTQAFGEGGSVEQINSVRVKVHERGSEAWFAPVLWESVTGMESRVTASAVRRITGASEVDCYLPLAVPDCYFTAENKESYANKTLRLSPAGDDNMGWVRAGDDSVNADWLRDQMIDPCQGGTAGIGDSVDLHNGVVTPVMDELETQIETNGTNWSPEMGEMPPQEEGSTVDTYGKTWEAPLLVFDGGPEYCEEGGGSWNGTETVMGIAWGVLYDVDNMGGAADRNMYMRVDFVRMWEVGTAGQGPNFGVNHRGITQLVE